MHTDTIDDFPLPCKKFLRYGIWRPQSERCLGSVLILPDYGGKLEDLTPLIAQLTLRGFHVASFDWFAQAAHQRGRGDILPAPMSDFRIYLQNWQNIFSDLLLVRLPAPFYGIGMGAGAVLGLAAHHILQSQLRRMLLISPLFAPQGHKVGGPFHRYVRFMSDLGLDGWRTNQPITDGAPPHDPIIMARLAFAGQGKSLYPTLGCYQGLLDAAQLVLSPDYREKISIPFLCMLSSSDMLSETKLARQFCESLRCAASITLRHAKRLPFEGDSPQTRQFWRAVDAFIPGTGAPSPDRSLEDGLVI